MSLFAPSRREQMRLRLAVQGPAGSGKTPLAFLLAKGLSPNGSFAVIDTEHRALEYADRYDFGHIAPDNADPEDLPRLVAAAGREGFGSLVIDSFTHYWSGLGGALDRVDRKTDKRAGWSEYRPIEAAMMRAILTYPGHVIATMRVKTEYVVEADKNGRNQSRRVGMKADQRDSVDYEFSVIGELDDSHTLTIVKSTCEALADRRITRPGRDLVDTLAEWLGQGEPMPSIMDYRDRAIDPSATVEVLREIFREASRRNLIAAPLMDENGDVTTLGALINRLGAERKPLQLATAVKDAA
jgi:hypothetical protein